MTACDLDKVELVLEGKGVDLHNELLAFRNAIGSLRNMILRFPTTVEEDEALLARDDLTANTRNAVLLRLSQKEIIADNILMLGRLWDVILLEGKFVGGLPAV